MRASAELVDLLVTGARGGLGEPDKVRLAELLGGITPYQCDRLLAGLREMLPIVVRSAVARATSEALNSGDGSYKP